MAPATVRPSPPASTAAIATRAGVPYGVGVTAWLNTGFGQYLPEGDLDTRLYAWPGATDAPAQDLNTDLGGLNGEALFATGEHEVYVLSDDGNRKIDGKKCKNVDLDKKKFRGIRVGM